jgi:glutamine synthetase
MKSDRIVQQTLGQKLFERYVDAKTSEWDEFRTHVSEWEVNRYLETT